MPDSLNLPLYSRSPITIDYWNFPQDHSVQTPLFSELYGVYSKGFPHGARQPSFFDRMFALNRNQSVQSQWGPACYEIAYARRQGKIVGTAMYIIIVAPRGGWPDSPYHAAVGIDYRSVLPEARGGGIAGGFETRAITRAATWLEQSGRVRRANEALVFPFNEMSRPLAMPLGAFADDVRLAKINPFDRVNTWNKAGLLRVIPSPYIPNYIEPPSVDGDEECHYYSFNVKTNGAPIGARTIEDVVLRYAALRRMDGADPRQDPAFRLMLAQLRQKNNLTPVADALDLHPFREFADALLGLYPHAIPPEIAHYSLGSLIHSGYGSAH